MSQLSSIADLRAQHGPAPIDSFAAETVATQQVQPGGFGAVFDLSDLDGDNGFRLTNSEQNAASSWSAASAGDVNGDGYDDLIVGAPSADPHNYNSGASYVVFGHAGGFDASLDLSALDGTDGFKLSGPDGAGYSGWSVASAGDVNGDGFADLIIGAPQTDGEDGSSDDGASYVVFGHAGGFSPNVELSALKGSDGFMIVGEQANERIGFSVASAGDINGDGFDDIVIGGPNASVQDYGYAGAAYVVFGRASGFKATLDLGDLKASAGFQISGLSAFFLTGTSVASAGDVNGDGLDDLIIAAHNAGSDKQGEAYVVFGRASGFGTDLDLSTLNGANGFTIHGAYDNARIAWSVASAGDVNGDGFADVIVGSPQMAQSYVVFGHKGGFDADIDVSTLNGKNGFIVSGASPYDQTGYSVASAGDVNGDGFDDIIVGARAADQVGYNSGAAYVVYGRAKGFVADLNLGDINGGNGFRIDATSYGAQLGWSVASAGDVNGDGLDDLILSTPFADVSQGLGESYIVFGKLPIAAVHLKGTAASQSLVGGDAKDSLSGLGGDDMLWGHGGKDKLIGGTGNDTLIGGAGKDVLTGGAGDDVFAFKAVGDSTAKAPDTITDLAAGDRIDLSMIDASTTSSGDQAFHLVASFTHHAGELTVSYNAAKDQTVVQGDVNGDGTADLAITVTGDHHDFTDFVL